MSTTDPIRALCAELAGCLDDALTFTVQGDTERSMRQLVARARELLVTQPPEPVEGPISVEELRAGWNQQADEFNQWESLDLGEQLAWAQARAVARYSNRRPELAEGLSDEVLQDILDLAMKWFHSGGEYVLADYRRDARAVLARYGTPSPAPIPVAERPWERDGWCDAKGRCWIWDSEDKQWGYFIPASLIDCFTHCLPHDPLPLPEVKS